MPRTTAGCSCARGPKLITHSQPSATVLHTIATAIAVKIAASARPIAVGLVDHFGRR